MWQQPLVDLQGYASQTWTAVEYYALNPHLLWPGVIALAAALIGLNILRELRYWVARRFFGRAGLPPHAHAYYIRGLMTDILYGGIQRAYERNLIGLRDRNYMLHWAAQAMKLPDVVPNRRSIRRTGKIAWQHVHNLKVLATEGLQAIRNLKMRLPDRKRTEEDRDRRARRVAM